MSEEGRDEGSRTLVEVRPNRSREGDRPGKSFVLCPHGKAERTERGSLERR